MSQQKPSISEKKKRAEDEKKLLEEEEVRLQAEEEERQIQMKEKEESKKNAIVRKKELIKRKAELDETREVLQEQRSRLEQLELERRNLYAWKRYFRCDGSPNPTIEKEVNTFMSLWRMDETRLTMEEVMTESVESLKLIDELRTLVSDIGENEEDHQTLMTYRRTMHELRLLVHEKLDRATIETLSRAVKFADHETSNLQKTWRNDWIAISIWANLSKNPRQNRQVSQSAPTGKPHSTVLYDDEEEIQMKEDIEDVQENKENEEQNQKEGSEKQDELTNVFDELKEKHSSEDGEELTVEVEEVIEPPVEDSAPTPDLEEWARATLCVDGVDLGEYHVIGGVIRFDLLTLPRQPKAGRGWNITTCVKPPKLTPFEYVVDTPMLTQNPAQAESTGNIESRKEERKDEKPPVQVKFRLPQCLVIAEDPLLARWDPEMSQWRTSGIELENFKEDENLVVFRTSVFGTMAIFQDFHINMPFQSWELRPLPLRVSHPRNSVLPPMNGGANELNGTATDQPQVVATSSTAVYRSHGIGQRATQLNNEPAKDAMSISAVDGTITEPTKDSGKVGPDNQEQLMILGPVPTLGLSDETYLTELPDTNQCILTITGGLTELRLHILGERISVLPTLPEQPREQSEMGDTSMVGAGASVGASAAGGGGGGGSGTATAAVAASEADAVPAESLSFHRKELTHLHGRWFTPDELITVLQLSGVNIFPREDSVCRVECLDKNPITEHRLYEQMALLSPAFAFGWSRWNADCDDRNMIIFTAVEHVDKDATVDEETWRVYAMTRKKVERLKMKEYEETLNLKVDADQPFHADMYHMCMDIGSNVAQQRINKIDLKYMKTVKQILQATRLVVFS